MKTEVQDEFDEAKHLAMMEASDKFAEKIIEEKCKRCVDFEKVLVHTNCICEPILILIAEHATQAGESESIIACWMTKQKVNREGK